MTEEYDLDIPVVEGGSGFDVTKYEGKRVKIASVKRDKFKNFYPNGEYDPNSTEEVWKVEIETEALKEVDEEGNFTEKEIEFPQEDGSVKKCTVSARFGLKEIEENGEKKVVISKHPKAALWNFMQKLGVQKLSELKGMYVTLTTVPSRKDGDDRRFLRIVQ
jgi:hypothetical protein